MFNRKTSSGFPSHNIIGPATIVTGEIISDGDFRVDGEFNGTVNIKGELIVGPSGTITGDIKAKSGEISGKVNAVMHFDQSVNLKSTCEVEGDITTNKLIIEEGCSYNGRCTMSVNKAE